MTFFIFFFTISNCPAQVRDTVSEARDNVEADTFIRHICLWIGYYNYGRNAVEAGIGKTSNGRVGYHCFASGYYFSSEFFEHSTWFIGPKAGIWASGGSGAITVGMSVIAYTNFATSSLQLRPEIGFGLNFFRVYYARNLRLTNKNFEVVDKNALCVNFPLNIERLKDKIRARRVSLRQ